MAVVEQLVAGREAAPIGDIFVTATGNLGVITLEHMKAMKNQALEQRLGTEGSS